jgi:hypothetical protein
MYPLQRRLCHDQLMHARLSLSASVALFDPHPNLPRYQREKSTRIDAGSETETTLVSGR